MSKHIKRAAYGVAGASWQAVSYLFSQETLEYDRLFNVLDNLMSDQDFVEDNGQQSSFDLILDKVRQASKTNSTGLFKIIQEIGVTKGLGVVGSSINITDIAKLCLIGINYKLIDPAAFVLHPRFHKFLFDNSAKLADLLVLVIKNNPDLVDFNEEECKRDFVRVFNKLALFSKVAAEKVAARPDLKPADALGVILREEVEDTFKKDDVRADTRIFSALQELTEAGFILAAKQSANIDRLVSSLALDSTTVKTDALVEELGKIIKKANEFNAADADFNFTELLEKYKEQGQFYDSYVAATIRKRDLSHIDFSDKGNIQFKNFKMRDINFSEAIFKNTSFARSTLTNCEFTFAVFNKSTSFAGATIDDKTFKSMLPSLRVAAAKGIEIDMSSVKILGDISNLDLSGINLSGADLTAAKFKEINVYGTNLSGCIFSESQRLSMENYQQAVIASTNPALLGIFTHDAQRPLVEAIKILKEKFIKEIQGNFKLASPKVIEQLWKDVEQQLKSQLKDKDLTAQIVVLNSLAEKHLPVFVGKLRFIKLNGQPAIIPQEKRMLRSGKDISLVESKGKQDITFRLREPIADFQYLVGQCVKDRFEQITKDPSFAINCSVKQVEIDKEKLALQEKHQHPIPQTPIVAALDKEEVKRRKQIRVFSQVLMNNAIKQFSNLRKQDFSKLTYDTIELEERLYQRLKVMDPKDVDTYLQIMKEQIHRMPYELLSGQIEHLGFKENQLIIKPSLIEGVVKNFVDIKESDKLNFSEYRSYREQGKEKPALISDRDEEILATTIERVKTYDLRALSSVNKLTDVFTPSGILHVLPKFVYHNFGKVVKGIISGIANMGYRFVTSFSLNPITLYENMKNFYNDTKVWYNEVKSLYKDSVVSFIPKFMDTVSLGRRYAPSEEMLGGYGNLVIKLLENGCLFDIDKNGKKVPNDNICLLVNKIPGLDFGRFFTDAEMKEVLQLAADLFPVKAESRKMFSMINSQYYKEMEGIIKSGDRDKMQEFLAKVTKQQLVPKENLEEFAMIFKKNMLLTGVKELLKTEDSSKTLSNGMQKLIHSGNSKKIAEFIANVKKDFNLGEEQTGRFTSALSKIFGYVTNQIANQISQKRNMLLPIAKFAAFEEASSHKRTNGEVFDMDKALGHTNSSFQDCVVNADQALLDLSRIRMSKPKFITSDFTNIDFSSSEIKQASYSKCTFSLVNFDNIDLRGTTFDGCKIDNVSLKNCNLSGMEWKTVKMSGKIDISGATFLNQKDFSDFIEASYGAKVVGHDKVKFEISPMLSALAKTGKATKQASAPISQEKLDKDKQQKK